MNLRSVHVIATALLVAPACADKSPLPGEQGSTRLQVAVAPLDLPGIDQATYTLRVHNAGGALVWEKTGLTSTQYGDGRGSLTYVGPCDADQSPNSVTLILESLSTGGVALSDPEDFRNPAPAPDGITKADVACVENQDTLVELNLTVLRAARQGFFDIAVEFQDVFCSAKLDCQDVLLHYPEGHPDGPGRGPTAVIGFACTGGTDDAATWLYLNQPRIVCGTAPDEVSFAMTPDEPLGNHGPLPPVAWQTAVYSGQEQFEDFDKCYWNLALGLELDALTELAPCRVELTGTASGVRFDQGWSPDAVFPVIHWSVPLDPSGDPACQAHALNADGSGVQTTYTDFSGELFAYELDCATGEIDPPAGYACEGVADGARVSVNMVSETELVATIGTTTSAPYRLPANMRLAQTDGGAIGCCVDPCCAD